MGASIILLGPHRVGKSTVGRVLAERLGMPLRPLAELNARYFPEAGCDEEEMGRRWAQGFEAAYRYVKPCEAHALERALAEYPDSIIEVESTQSVYEDDALLSQVQEALRPYSNVVLLLPSPDPDASVRILEERQRVTVAGMDANEYFVRHPSNRELATVTIYTKGQTPEETRDEILRRVGPSQREIVLIGPMRAGKSTIGKLLAESLGVPEVVMDAIRWDLYREIGFDEAEQARIADAEGFGGVLRYWKRFEIHAVERLLAEHRDRVIHFGAGHSAYDDEEHRARARRALAPYPTVVLLLPSPDPDESVAILRERTRLTVGGVDLNRYLSTHPSLHALARFTVYTDGREPGETAEEIARLVGR